MTLNFKTRIFEMVEGYYERWLEETVLKIDEGIESLERGEGVEVEIVFNRLREKLRQAKAY